MEWLVSLEVVATAVVVALVSFIVLVWVRRRHLSRYGGVFDCAVRLSPQRPRGWALGMARYRGEELQWYRVFSLALRPRLVLLRRDTRWVSQRTPESAESLVLFDDHEVVTLSGVDRRGRARTWDLAMDPGSATGLMSWLEAAPPGAGYLGTDEE